MPPTRVSLRYALPLGVVDHGAVTLTMVATAAECQALADDFKVSQIDRLEAALTVVRRAGGLVRVEGDLQATVVQECVVTLEPVTQEISDHFVRDFGAAPGGDMIDPESGELVLDPLEDPPDPLPTEGGLPLGEVVAEQLALAIDPYPRHPDADLATLVEPEPEAEPAAPASPFAVLARLKPKS